MATPQLDFDPWNDSPASAAGSGARAAGKAPVIDFDPWAETQAANDAPTPGPIVAQPKATSTTDKPGFLRTGWEALKRGGASAIASTAHTVADTIDQVVQAPVRQVVGALGQAAKADPAAVRAFEDPLGARAVAEENLGVAREIAADHRAVAERIGPRPGLADWKAHPGEAARSAALRLTNAAGESVPLLAAAVATRNPTAGAALMGGVSGAQAFTDLRADGVDRTTAAQAGLLTGAIEAAGEGVSLPAVMGKAGRGSIVRAAVAEGAQEAPVSVAQQNVDDQARGKETPVGEQLLSALDAALVGGALGAGAHVAGAQRSGAERQPGARGDDVPRGNELPPETLALPSPDRTPDHGVMYVNPDGTTTPAAQAAQARHPGFARPQQDVPAQDVLAPAMQFLDANPGNLADAGNALPSGPATWEQWQAGIAFDARDVQQQRRKDAELDALAEDSRLPVALRNADQADTLRHATGVDAFEAVPNAMQAAMRRAQQEAGATRAEAATMRATAQGPLTRIGADVLDQRADVIEQWITEFAPAPGVPVLDFDPHSDLPDVSGPPVGVSTIAAGNLSGNPSGVLGAAGDRAAAGALPDLAEVVTTQVATGNSKIARAREETPEVRIEPLGPKGLLVRGDVAAVRQQLVDAGVAKAARARIQDGALRFDAKERPAIEQALGMDMFASREQVNPSSVDMFTNRENPNTSAAIRSETAGIPAGLDFDPHADLPDAPASILYGKRRQQSVQGANPETTARAEARIARMFGEQPAQHPVPTPVTSQHPVGLDFDPTRDVPAGASLRRDHADRLVRRFTKSLPGAPEIVLVDSAEELHRLAGVQADGAGARAEGLYNGKPAVFLNTAAIDNPKRFRQVLAHEVVGHFGVEQVVGDAWPHIAQTVVRHVEKGTGARWMREAIAKARASQPGVTDPQALAREVVAVLAEQGSKNSLLSTVIARTRATLRKAIPSVAWTDRDVRDVLTQAEGFLRQRPTVPPVGEQRLQQSDAAIGETAFYSKPGEAPADVAGVAPQFEHVTNPQRAALGKIATHRPKESLPERADRLTRNLRARILQGTVDQFHAFRDLDETAYMQARLSKGTDGAVEGVFRYGTPKLTDGALDIQGDGKGFLGHLQDLQGEHDLFLAWVAGHRSEQLAKEGREHLFTPDDIAALKQLNKGHLPDGRSREAVYRQALQQLNRYQSAILDIAQEAGIVNDASRKLWNADFYVPFFRDMAGQPAPAPHPIRGGDEPGDIAAMRKAVIEKLVGGGQPLNDLLENTLQNWGRLLASSMRNMAATRALNVAVDIGAAKPMPAAERGTVSALFHGERRHFMVEEPLVLESLVMLYAPPWSNPAMKSLQWFKRALTIGVTTDPSFRIRNLIRDSLSVVASNGIGANPLRNIVQGWKATERGGDTYLKLLGGGGAIRFGSVLDGDQAAHAKRLIEAGLAKKGDILSTPAKAKAGLVKLWDAYQEIGDRAETMNRAALYEQAIAAGKSHLEASYAARDTLDFTNTGAWPAVQFLTRVVPFMNARLQGLYKLGRGAKQYPRRFAAVAGAVAMASVLLHLLNQDDEDYRALPDWVRDTYWWIRVPGTDHALYIPKPFELGALGSVAERGTELALAGDDYQLADFAGTLRSILSSQLSMNPIPQAVRPAMEAAFNWNSFQGRPIDSMGQERLPAEDRHTARTSGGAVALGKLTNSSPQKIEHLVRGYFGWLGLQALNVSDLMARDMLALGANPAHDFGKVDNLALIGSFIKERDAGSSKYVQRFYDQQRDVDMLYAAYAAARQAGDVERARELAGDDRLKLRGLYQAANREMTKVNRRIRQVTSDKQLSAEAKGELLGGLAQVRDTLAERTTERAREVEARQERAR